MSEQPLRAALLKLQGSASVPASQFTPAQRSALDRFARHTGAVHFQRQGRGDAYSVRNQAVFETHLLALSPQGAQPVDSALPARAQHIAYARGSKARSHQHSAHYVLLKAVGESVAWQQEAPAQTLPLDAFTRQFGAAALCIEADDSWQSQQPLWLVENQALFDRTDWLPAGTCATLLYYGGQLDGRLLSWLAKRPRASRVVLFPDYDGVGLSNFARLYARLGDACECWLMPHWEVKLARYGSRQLWQETLRHLPGAIDQLPAYMGALASQMQRSGLALEQEAVWLPEVASIAQEDRTAPREREQV